MEEHFDPEGLELEPWVPEDWTPEPEFIANLRKPALRNLAKRIAKLWKDLSRKIKEDVKDHANLYSIIYVPNGFVVPGGKSIYLVNFLVVSNPILRAIHASYVETNLSNGFSNDVVDREKWFWTLFLFHGVNEDICHDEPRVALVTRKSPL